MSSPVNKFSDHLSAYGDPEQILKRQDTIISPFGELNSLDLSTLKISNLEPNAFVGFRKLWKIKLANNALEELPQDIFSKNRGLREIDLGHNRLNILPEGLFQNVGLLQILKLNDNKLSKLPSEIFSPVKNLRQLDLSQNLLNTLPHSFSKLENLAILSLTENRFQEDLSVDLINKSSVDQFLEKHMKLLLGG